MVMLYVSFRIPYIVSALALKRGKGMDPERAERLFSPESRREIADFPGLIWKVWAISEDGRTGSGFYLFNTRADAEARARYAKKYYPRDGLYRVRCVIYDVLPECSRATRAPIDLPANPGIAPGGYEELCRNHKGVNFVRLLFENK
jgi:hypothetical protein